MTVCGGCGYRRKEEDGRFLDVCSVCDIPYSRSQGSEAVPVPFVPLTSSLVKGAKVQPGSHTVAREKKRLRHHVEGGPSSDGVTQALLFAVILALGCFTPLISVPFIGSVTATQFEFLAGYILLALAGHAAWLAWSGKIREVRWPGGIALCLVLAHSVNFLIGLKQTKVGTRGDLHDSLVGGLVEAVFQIEHLQWGWVPLVIGASGLIVVGIGGRLPLKRNRISFKSAESDYYR